MSESKIELQAIHAAVGCSQVCVSYGQVYEGKKYKYGYNRLLAGYEALSHPRRRKRLTSVSVCGQAYTGLIEVTSVMKVNKGR